MANKVTTQQQRQSIIPAEMRGVEKITGYRGKGKTNYVATVEDPTLTVFFDFEKKGEGIDNQLNFGRYVPVTEQAKGGGTAIWDLLLKEIANLPSNTFTHVILDNTAPLETSMRSEAAKNARLYAEKFGMDASNIAANRYGGQGGVVNYLISEQLCNPLWAKGVKLISVTSHIKPRWQGGVTIANSYNLKGADRWDELSILTLILIPGEFAPAPSALVHKEQLGTVHYDAVTRKFTRARRLPYRLPLAQPEQVVEYLLHPADLKNPKPGEFPTESEMAPFKEELSKEQIAMVFAELEQNKIRFAEEHPELARTSVNKNDSLKARQSRAKELSAKQMKAVDVAKQLNTEFDVKTNPGDVVRWLMEQ